MADPGTAADRNAIEAAAKVIRDFLNLRSPGEKSRGSWRILRFADSTIAIQSREITAVMTDLNKRHPLFGNRKKWYHENQSSPQRTGWAERAVYEGADDAAQRFGDTWITTYAIESPIFDLE